MNIEAQDKNSIYKGKRHSRRRSMRHRKRAEQAETDVRKRDGECGQHTKYPSSLRMIEISHKLPRLRTTCSPNRVGAKLNQSNWVRTALSSYVVVVTSFRVILFRCIYWARTEVTRQKTNAQTHKTTRRHNKTDKDSSET